MDFLPGPFVALVVVAVFILASGIKIASEHERFAVFRLGRFIGFKGSGLCFKLGTTQKWVKIKPGDRGELMATALADINGADVLVQVDGKLTVGQFVRVTGFRGDQVLVSPDPIQGRTIVCQKCGHMNQI
jgi:regulator of protease activity HflC (stomatin/prohibitin superfamily)